MLDEPEDDDQTMQSEALGEEVSDGENGNANEGEAAHSHSHSHSHTRASAKPQTKLQSKLQSKAQSKPQAKSRDKPESTGDVVLDRELADLRYYERKLGIKANDPRSQQKLRKQMEDDGMGDLFGQSCLRVFVGVFVCVAVEYCTVDSVCVCCRFLRLV